MVEAFGYLRVSGKGQLTGDGFPRQRAAIERHAKAHGFRIVRFFEERGVAGATEWESRPGWLEMMAELNGVRTILIERLDRLARDLMVQEHIIADVMKRGITLVSTTEPDLCSTDATRVLIRQVLGAVAAYDKTMTVMKLRHARNRVRASGARCEGRKAYGTQPAEEAIVEEMRGLRQAGWTFQAIAQSLNDKGVATRTAGGRWDGRTCQRIIERA